MFMVKCTDYKMCGHLNVSTAVFKTMDLNLQLCIARVFWIACDVCINRYCESHSVKEPLGGSILWHNHYH